MHSPILLPLLAFIFAAAVAPAATIVWSGAGDGSRWLDPNNWNPPSEGAPKRVPTTGDDVILVAAAGATVVIDGVALCTSIDTGSPGTLRIDSSASLSVETLGTFDMAVEMNGAGRINGNAALEFTNRVAMNGTSAIVAFAVGPIPQTTFTQSSQLVVENGRIDNRLLTMNGSMEWGGSQRFTVSGESLFADGGRLLILSGDGAILDGERMTFTEDSGGIRIENAGTPTILSPVTLQSCPMENVSGSVRFAGAIDFDNIAANGIVIAADGDLRDCTFRSTIFDFESPGGASMDLNVFDSALGDGPSLSLGDDTFLGANVRFTTFGDATIEVLGATPGAPSVTMVGARFLGTGAVFAGETSVLEAIPLPPELQGGSAPETSHFDIATEIRGALNLRAGAEVLGEGTITMPPGSSFLAEEDIFFDVPTDCAGAALVQKSAGSASGRGEAFLGSEFILEGAATFAIGPAMDVSFARQSIVRQGFVVGAGTSVAIDGNASLTVGDGFSEGTIEAFAPSGRFCVRDGRFHSRSGATFTVARLAVEGTSILAEDQDAQLEVEADLSLAELQLLGDANLRGRNVTIVDTLRWHGGDFVLDGTATLLPGGSGSLAGTADGFPNVEFAVDGATSVLRNEGEMLWAGTNARMRLRNGGRFENRSLLSIEGDGDVVRTGSGTFENDGIFWKVSGVSVIDGFVYTGGAVEVLGGELSLGEGESAGTFVVAAGALLTGSGHRFLGGTDVTGAGLFGPRLDLVIDGEVACDNALLDHGSTTVGRVTGSGRLFIREVARWSTADIAMGTNGVIETAPGCSFTIEVDDPIGLNTFFSGGTIRNGGPCVWSAASTGGIFADTPAAFHNLATGSFSIESENPIFLNTNNARRITFTNDGELFRPGAVRGARGKTGPAIADFGAKLVNAGSARFETGTTVLPGNYRQTGGETTLEAAVLRSVTRDQNGVEAPASTPVSIEGGVLRCVQNSQVLGGLNVGGNAQLVVENGTFTSGGAFTVAGELVMQSAALSLAGQGADGFLGPQTTDGEIVGKVTFFAGENKIFGDLVVREGALLVLFQGAEAATAGDFAMRGRLEMEDQSVVRHHLRGVGDTLGPLSSLAEYAGRISIPPQAQVRMIAQDMTFLETAFLELGEEAILNMIANVAFGGECVLLDLSQWQAEVPNPDGTSTGTAATVDVDGGKLTIEQRATLDAVLNFGTGIFRGASAELLLRADAVLSITEPLSFGPLSSVTAEVRGGATPAAGGVNAVGVGAFVQLGGQFRVASAADNVAPVPAGSTLRIFQAPSVVGSFDSFGNMTVPGGTFNTVAGPTFFDLSLGGSAAAAGTGWLLY